MTPSRLVGYVRLSRERDDSTSVARQRQLIERHAEALGAVLIDVVEDVDVSASKTRLDRPGLTRVRAMLADREADAVLVWRLDRLARSVVDFGTLLDEKVNVISCTEPLDTTSPMGRAMAEVLQVFAALESRTIGERLKSTIAYRVGQGDRWRGGPPPFGYRSVPHPSGDGRTLKIDPTEAAALRDAAERVLGGASLYSVVQALNAKGSVPRRAAAWSISSLRVVLTGDSALGRQTRFGEVTRDADGVIAQPWPAILKVEDVERLRALLAPRPLGMTRRKASRLLSGLLECATCHRSMRVNSRRTTSGTAEAYGCRTNGDGAVCARPASINADGVEAFIRDELLAVVGDTAVVEYREVVRSATDLSPIDEAIQHTTDAMRAPTADVEALVQRLHALRETRAEVAARPATPTIETVETGETFRERWDGSDTAGRRTLLQQTLRGPIVVYPIGRGYRRIDSDRVAAPWPWVNGETHTFREGESRGPGRRTPGATPGARRVDAGCGPAAGSALARRDERDGSYVTFYSPLESSSP